MLALISIIVGTCICSPSSNSLYTYSVVSKAKWRCQGRCEQIPSYVTCKAVGNLSDIISINPDMSFHVHANEKKKLIFETDLKSTKNIRM